MVAAQAAMRQPNDANPAQAKAPSPLVALLTLESQIRAVTTIDALRILVCNEGRRVIPYRQAFVMECTAGAWSVSAISSVSLPDKNSPLLQSLAKLVASQSLTKSLLPLDLSEAGADFGQAAYPFSKGLLAPLYDRAGNVFAALLLAREVDWSEAEYALVGAMADATSHGWLALKPRRSFLALRPGKRIIAAIAVGLALISIVPVPLTALAPAEVVGRQPVVVSASIDGVVATLPLPPNSTVAEGDVILTFVDTKLRNDAEIADQSRAVAAAKLHRLIQSAFGAPKDAHEIAIARAELALAEAELQRARELLDRAVVRAPRGRAGLFGA